MRRITLLAMLCILVTQFAQAKLAVATAGDGTVTLTLNAAGDLDAEFTGQYAAAQPTAFLAASGALTARKLKVATAPGVRMTQADLYRLYGESYGGYQHFVLRELDLSEAELQSDNDLRGLAWLTSMKKVTYPATTSSIPTTFSDGSRCQIEEVVIPDNAAIGLTVAQQAFHNKSLKKVVFGARSSIHIGNLCFQGNPNLTTVDFHYGSTSIVIGTQAFDRCTGLKNIVLPEGVTEIGAGAFLGAGIEAIRLPNSLRVIRTKAFAQCAELRSITIPEGVEQIETATFENNYNLADVYVLGNHTKCAEGAFTDNITYKYQAGTCTDGQTGVTRDLYTPEDGNMKVVTRLHFMREAYDDYTNEYVKVIGTAGYSSSPYGNHPELNHWVFDADGNRLPVKHSDYFEGLHGDYAGWKNFMLTDSTLGKKITVDSVRVRDKWYTMCLPFDMTAAQLKSAYGAGLEVVEFSAVSSEMEGAGRKYITLHFTTPVTATRAHHPYMIHPAIHAGSTPGVKTTIVGIQKKPQTDAALDGETVVQTCDGVAYTFRGNYAQGKSLQQYSYYYYSGDDESQWPNAFYKWTSAAGGTWTPGFACVLASADDGALAKAQSVYGAETGDDTPTGITPLHAAAPRTAASAPRGVYGPDGRLVRAGSSLDGLPKGFYIVNGKKYVVK